MNKEEYRKKLLDEYKQSKNKKFTVKKEEDPNDPIIRRVRELKKML